MEVHDMDYGLSIRSSDGSVRNDCTVRAIANAFGLTYDEAAAQCKQAGRKRKNCGMTAKDVFAWFDSRSDLKRIGSTAVIRFRHEAKKLTNGYASPRHT
jgi:hypothetical protein